MTRRFNAQRWLIDNVIRSVGIDWDQPRSASYGPMPQMLAADWMQARLAGKPFASERWFVEATGRVLNTAYPAA